MPLLTSSTWRWVSLGFCRSEERGWPLHSVCPHPLPTTSFPVTKGNRWVQFVRISCAFLLQDYVLWLGLWEFCLCRPPPESRHFYNFPGQEAGVQATQAAFSASRGLRARASCSGQGSSLTDLEWGCFPQPGAGSMPTF